jgi:cytoskeletal protein RodZ
MDDFGGKLRQARERRGISLRQIAAITKISAAALEGLERNDISKLPGGIFSRAFVRSYAAEIGLDPEETVREFLARFSQEPPVTPETLAAAVPERERSFRQQQRKAARTLTIAGVAFVLLAVGAFVVLRHRGKQTPTTTGAASAPDPPTAAAATSASARQAPTGSVNLDIHPTSDCWVSLTVDGKKLFARVMKPGERESHAVEREAILEIGDAGAFAYSVNGHPGRPVGDRGESKTLKLTPVTASEYVR